MKKNFILLFAFSIFFSICVFAETDGEKYFKENNPEAAIQFLEREITLGQASSDAYNYLGLAYYQVGNYKKSVATFEKGLSVQGTNKKILAYNAGNSSFAMGEWEKAENYYSLALAASPSFTKALLNRANARLKQNKLDLSVADYERYIALEVDDPQYDEIERLIALIKRAKARQEEEARIALEKERQRQAEEAALKAEQERLAREKARQEEEARLEAARIAAEKARIEAEKKAAEERAERERLRREAELKAEQERLAREREREEAEARAREEERKRKLLEELANSLQDTNTQSMTSGAEDMLDYDYESELD